MSTTIGQIADTPTTVVRLYPYGAIPVNVAQNILGIIGTSSSGPAMTVQAFTSSQEVTSTFEAGPLCRAGQLAFYNSLQDAYMVRVLGDGYTTATYQLKDSVGGQNNAGVLTAVPSGVRGNSLSMDIAYGTFYSHDVEYFVGDGTVGPYYLEFDELVGPWPATGQDKNSVKVDNVPFKPVYDIGLLETGTVFVDTLNGSLTFFDGPNDIPSEYSSITCDIAYQTRKVTLHDGSTTYPAIDVLSDPSAIEAAFANNALVHYTADATNTHLPAIGTYKLAGGLDGAAITSNDWFNAFWVLRDYLDQVKTGITAITVTQASVTDGDGSYDLISMLEGQLAEMEQDWEPCLGLIGMDENEDPGVAIQVVSSHSHRNLMVIANPWGGEQDPPRTNGWVALAAREAQISLGDDTGERSSLNALMGMQGLLNIYRKATVRGLQNNRICVLVKEDAGLFPNWSRTVGWDWQFADAVDNRTINYVLRMLYAISKHYYFKKNIPDVRNDFKRSIAIELNRLLEKYIAVKYILEVKGPGDRGYKYTDNGRVDVNLVMENVGHIKRIVIDYGVGIIESGENVVYAPNIYSQEG
jgi:hypothetical protein